MKKLKKILLINWLYFSKEIIEVGDVNFLTGKNGAGKSTVIDALQIVLLGETNARNFNLAANERSQRTLDGYLRADMDENNPYSRRGKDFSTYIACEFEDDAEHSSFVNGVMFDCRSDGSPPRPFLYLRRKTAGKLLCRGRRGDGYSRSAQIPQAEFLPRRGVRYPVGVPPQHALAVERTQRAGAPHDEKGGVIPPDCGIQQFITENICDIPDKPISKCHAAEHPQLQAARAAGAAAGGKTDRAAGDQHAIPRNDALGGSLARAVLPCAVGAKGGHAGARSTAASRKSETACPS